MNDTDDVKVTRREFLITGASSVAAVTLPSTSAAQVPTPGQPIRANVSLQVNGQARQLNVDTRTTLLDALRENLQLTGTKKGCDHGQCGACTVLVNGRRINSCLTLAVMHQEDDILTIEGLGSADDLHPMQSAFLRHDGYQCGYCTPGQICSAVAMLDEVRKGWPSHVSGDLTDIDLTDAEISERMSGNICRCSAYPNIVDAIREVSGLPPAGREVAGAEA